MFTLSLPTELGSFFMPGGLSCSFTTQGGVGILLNLCQNEVNTGVYVVNTGLKVELHHILDDLDKNVVLEKRTCSKPLLFGESRKYIILYENFNYR